MSTSNIAEIRKPFAPDDIPATLRRIADEIEAGDHGLVTTCLVVTGHTEERPMADGGKLQSESHEVFGCGPRCDIYTSRGLLLTAAQRYSDDS